MIPAAPATAASKATASPRATPAAADTAALTEVKLASSAKGQTDRAAHVALAKRAPGPLDSTIVSLFPSAAAPAVQPVKAASKAAGGDEDGGSRANSLAYCLWGSYVCALPHTHRALRPHTHHVATVQMAWASVLFLATCGLAGIVWGTSAHPTARRFGSVPLGIVSWFAAAAVAVFEFRFSQQVPLLQEYKGSVVATLPVRGILYVVLGFPTLFSAATCMGGAALVSALRSSLARVTLPVTRRVCAGRCSQASRTLWG